MTDRPARSAVAQRDVEASDADDADVDQVLSDANLRRLLLVLGALVAAAIVVVAMFTAGRWAANDEPVESLGVVDVGFMQDMIDHHEQALLISNTYLANNPDGDAAPYAREVVLFQERDIARMETWLADDGLVRGDPERTAMTWMGMGSPVGEMPGMQDPARIEELGRSVGADADRLFFAMMSDHHLGGAHMADTAATGANRSEIREFATAMSRNQRVEVVEYDQAIERLGL